MQFLSVFSCLNLDFTVAAVSREISSSVRHSVPGAYLFGNLCKSLWHGLGAARA
jgi:hypothetical protein